MILQTLFLLTAVSSAHSKCDERLTVDITDGIRNDDTLSIEHEGRIYEKDNYHAWKMDNATLYRGCICAFGPCYRKCCRSGEVLDNGCKSRNTSQGYSVNIYEGKTRLDLSLADHFYEINNKFCYTDGLLMLEPEDGEEFYLQKTGELLYVQNGKENVSPPEEYCLELYDEKDYKGLRALICMKTNITGTNAHLYGGLMIISLPFLLVTFLIYVFVPELRNLHGKCVASYVWCLFVAYLFLIPIYLSGKTPDPTLCLIAPFVTYVFFMASFLWLNVMCFDVWWTFSGHRGFVNDRYIEIKKFRMYSAYTWGLTIIILIIVLVLQFVDKDKLPKNTILPKFAVDRCWFPDLRTQGYYMYGPMLFLIVINTILFVWTGINIWRVKRETERSMSNESKKHMHDGSKKYILYLKLFLAFGLNWSLELVPWLFGIQKPLQTVLDIINILYGIFIFYISICKRSVLNILKKKLPTITNVFHSSSGHSTTTAMSDLHPSKQN